MNPVPILIVVPGRIEDSNRATRAHRKHAHSDLTPVRLVSPRVSGQTLRLQLGSYTLVAEVGLVLRDALVACQLNRDLRLS